MLRRLPWTAVIAAALALIGGGYMVTDAIHRFVLGDFFRLGGQLGPWTVLVSGFGIDPLAMGPVFLIVGVVQIVAALLLLLQRRWGDVLVLALAVGTLWYLIFGTISSAVQIAFILASRRGRSPPQVAVVGLK